MDVVDLMDVYERTGAKRGGVIEPMVCDWCHKEISGLYIFSDKGSAAFCSKECASAFDKANFSNKIPGLMVG